MTLRAYRSALGLLCVAATALTVGCGAEPPTSPPVTLRDVSLVWPLPSAEETDLSASGHLLANTSIEDGRLLSRTVFDHLPPLTRVDEPDALYSGLTVVAARLDPCFQEGAGSPPCQPNLRLVLQPLVRTDTGWEARDASVHAFYSARSEREIVLTVKALTEARVVAGGEGSGPLGTHPLLGDVAGRTQVRNLLLPLLSPERLSRVTSIDVHGGNAAWTFSGFDWKNGAPVPLHVAPTGTAVDQHFLSASTELLSGLLEPPSSGPDDFALLLDAQRANTATAEERQHAFDAAARVENPNFHNPGTVDCVSCHVSAMARAAASRWSDLQASPDAFVASERHDLHTSSTFSDTRMVRALGYRFKELVLSPRVLNESAMVADRVDATLKME